MKYFHGIITQKNHKMVIIMAKNYQKLVFLKISHFENYQIFFLKKASNCPLKITSDISGTRHPPTAESISWPPDVTSITIKYTQSLAYKISEGAGIGNVPLQTTILRPNIRQAPKGDPGLLLVPCKYLQIDLFAQYKF